MPVTSRLRLWLAVLAALVLIPLAVAGIAAAAIWQQLPELSRLTDYQPKEPLRILTADGQLIGEFGAERRRFVPLDDMPPLLRDALLAVEDKDFWTHGGLDFSGMLRAGWRNLTHSGPLHGASTITQQLARDTYLSKEQRWGRKVYEILLALKLEQQLSKQQILEIYMNQIFMGNRAYGFAAAAERYFGKELQQLNLAEVAMLIGLPKDPVRVNPVSNLPRAKRRQAVVLGRLVDVGMITAAQAQAAREQALTIRKPRRLSSIADHAAEMVRAEVVARYGESAYERGLQVVTTLMADEQRAAQQGLRRALFDLERRQPHRGAEAQFELPEGEAAEAVMDRAFDRHPDLGELRSAMVLSADPKRVELELADGERVQLSGDALRPIQRRLAPQADAPIRRGSLLRLLNGAAEGKPARWQIGQAPQAEGAVVSLDPRTGAVRALVGGFDFARGQFNHATQAYRQPGSSFKPFVYSAAIELGAWPGTLVSDEPFVAGDWSPRNYDGEYEPQLTLRQAMARSKNMVTIRLAELLGPAAVRAWVERFGLDGQRQPLDLTVALGSGAVTPMQMAGAYAVFANGGMAQPMQLIQTITDQQDQLLYAAPPPGEGRRVISERNAFMTAQLLAAVMREGTGARGSQLLQRWDLYGKTGTTNDAVDAWFAGFQADRAGVVWIGYPQPRSLGARETGGGLALPVWAETMAVALRGKAPQPLPVPDGLIELDGDWFYLELGRELSLDRIGMPPPQPTDPSESASELLGLQPPSTASSP